MKCGFDSKRSQKIKKKKGPTFVEKKKEVKERREMGVVP